ncbi:MAG: OmpW family protein [Alphaproteobacteria bacterium]|nr:OmpW family protein [Alphaproteobacteria bacterium]
MRLLSLLTTAAALMAFSTHAEDGKWMIRARAIGVIPDESSSITPIGGSAEVDNSLVPEVDISYFFTPNIAVELIAATTPHDVKAEATALGTVDVGNAWLLPPTLTLQYHFTQFKDFKPYVGAGINYTIFYNEDAGALASVEYDESFGPALQAGVDIPLQGNWCLNFDVKKIWINTTASFNGGAVNADVDIDPWVIGAGFGYRF